MVVLELVQTKLPIETACGGATAMHCAGSFRWTLARTFVGREENLWSQQLLAIYHLHAI